VEITKRRVDDLISHEIAVESPSVLTLNTNGDTLGTSPQCDGRVHPLQVSGNRAKPKTVCTVFRNVLPRNAAKKCKSVTMVANHGNKPKMLHIPR
jgi:hypothetical protein